MSVKVSCTEAEVVEISKTEYNDLVRASERIAAVERFLAATRYPSVDDIAALLDINEKTESDVNVSSD